jgi:uncharacterized delta-60 repeat protein
MRRATLLAAMAVLGICAPVAVAQEPVPPVGSSSAYAVRQPDGKIVTVGNGIGCAALRIDCASGLGASRLDATGGPDPSFGSGGSATVGLVGPPPASVAVDAQGRILVVGSTPPGEQADVVLARFLPEGGLDAGFGSGGVATLGIDGGALEGRGVAVAADGKILVSTTYRTGAGTWFGAARFGEDGHPDPGFGAGGVARSGDGAVVPDYAGPIAVQPDGKVLVGAVARVGAASRVLAVARFDRDGKPDAGFAAGGVFSGDPVNEPLGGLTLQAVFADAAGHVFLAASERTSEHAPTDAVVIRLDSVGRPDPGFGEGGEGSASVPSASLVSATPLADGSVFLGLARGHGLTVARLKPDGRLDPTFNAGGKGIVAIAGLTTTPEAAFPDAEGGAVGLGLVRAAHCRRPDRPGWQLCRSQATISFKPNGFLRRSFGGVGFVTRPPIHYCPELPGTLCGIDMTAAQLEGLAGRGSPRKAHLKRGKVLFRVRCDRRVETRCRITTGVRLGSRPGGFTSKTVTVKAGQARLLRLPAPPGLARRLATADRPELRLPLRQRVVANGLSAAYVAGIRLLRR